MFCPFKSSFVLPFLSRHQIERQVNQSIELLRIWRGYPSEILTNIQLVQ